MNASQACYFFMKNPQHILNNYRVNITLETLRGPMDSLSTKLQHKSENQSATAELLIVTILLLVFEITMSISIMIWCQQSAIYY